MSLPRMYRSKLQYSQKAVDELENRSATLRRTKRLTLETARNSVCMMVSRVGSTGGHYNVQHTPRQVKKVSVPVVPDIGDMKSKLGGQNISEQCSSKSSSSTHSRCSILSPDNASDEQNSCYTALFRPNTLLALSTEHSLPYPSTNFTAIKQVCGVEYKGMDECSTVPGVSFLTTSSRPTLLNAKMEQNREDLYSHRNSNGSCSSRGSSSGFESMKSTSSPSCSASTAHGSNSSSHLVSSFSSPVQGMANGTLGRRGSPQSRSSLHSSSSGGSSSLTSGHVDTFEDTPSTSLSGCSAVEGPPVNVSNMLVQGIPEAEILALWLDNLGHPEFLSLFLTQGYDLSTIARITPEDLTALGVKEPSQRQLLHAEIRRWGISDSWPSVVPSGNVSEWLMLIGLSEYVKLFETQGFCSLNEVQKLTWEDFVDIGVKKLGHLKRLELAIKKMKNHRLNRTSAAENDKGAMSFDSCHSCYPQGNMYRHQAPPPPAPTSSFGFKNPQKPVHYATWSRRPRLHDSATDMESRDVKPVVQVFPNHRTSLPSQAFDVHDECLKSAMNNSDASLSSISALPRLHLHSPSRILSEEIFHDTEFEKRTMNSGSFSNVDENVGISDSADCPPPPAPLACEGSIRLLRSAYNNSAELLRMKKPSDGCGQLTVEQIPFANDNCGTIRSREASRYTGPGIAYQQKMPRTTLNKMFVNDADAAKRRPLPANGDVLNDIGYMLQNLTDELDAMLLPSETPCGMKASAQHQNSRETTPVLKS